MIYLWICVIYYRGEDLNDRNNSVGGHAAALQHDRGHQLRFAGLMGSRAGEVLRVQPEQRSAGSKRCHNFTHIFNRFGAVVIKQEFCNIFHFE